MNVADEFKNAALYCPDKNALIFGNISYTYAEMHRIIQNIAGYLPHLGVTKGDRISLYMPNRPEWILFYYGIARIGAISVCVPGAYKRHEMTGCRSRFALLHPRHLRSAPRPDPSSEKPFR